MRENKEGLLRSFHNRESGRGEERILLRCAAKHCVRKTVLPLSQKENAE